MSRTSRMNDISAPDDLTQGLEQVALAALRPHPRNYQEHPEDELAHIRQSLTTHGYYRNIVIASEGTILAGHGVVTAAQQLGWTHVPVRRMAYGPDDPQALQIVVGDNELGRLAVKDDARMTALLVELQAWDPTALLGTGFDAAFLTVPTFDPVRVDEQGRLDQKSPMECPACGHTWVP
jgi:ParB family transcriptional regulator, chromosome partitioning protein